MYIVVYQYYYTLDIRYYIFYIKYTKVSIHSIQISGQIPPVKYFNTAVTQLHLLLEGQTT